MVFQIFKYFPSKINGIDKLICVLDNTETYNAKLQIKKTLVIHRVFILP